MMQGISEKNTTLLGLPRVANIFLHNLKNRKWYVQCTSAYTGNGIYEGLEWLSNNID